MSDTELFATVRNELTTAVIGDVLDALGHAHQFLPQAIQPIVPEWILVGRAMPVLIGDVFGEQPMPFGRMTEALDQLESGDVYLARSGRLECSAWGELLTTAARGHGAVGAVIDGYHRDTARILGQDWPVFSRGSYAQDARIRSAVLDYRVPVRIGQVEVSPGDLVVGDRDGVVVVPRSVQNEVVERSVAKARVEDQIRVAIAEGMSTTDAFAEFGVL